MAENCKGTSCLVPKLQEGHKYLFRVSAENANGPSKPLETEDPVTAKNPFGEEKSPEYTDPISEFDFNSQLFTCTCAPDWEGCLI